MRQAGKPEPRFLLLYVIFLLLISGCSPAAQMDRPGPEMEPVSYRIDGTYLANSGLTIVSSGRPEAAVCVTNNGTVQLVDSVVVKFGEAAATAAQETSGPPRKGSGPPMGGHGGSGFGMPPGPPPGNMAGGPYGRPDDERKPSGAAGQSGPSPDSFVIGKRTAGVFVGTQSSAQLSSVRILTSLQEGKGLCAIGADAKILLQQGSIMTDGGSSHGVFAAEGGTVTLKDVAVLTRGEHSSAVATDQGGGRITVTGGTYIATGKYSAGLYSTGDIRVAESDIEAYADNAVVVEGGSSVSLQNSRVTAHEKGAVMIYQSFSGDASMGTSQFRMSSGELTAWSGPLFYATNTDAAVHLHGVELRGEEGILLRALKGDWGVDLPGAKPTRGAKVTLVAEEQQLSGDIVVDEYSTVEVHLQNRSSLHGAINANNKGAQVSVSFDVASNWQVTGDSHVKRISMSQGSLSAVVEHLIGNGHTVYYDPQSCPELLEKRYALAQGGQLRPESSGDYADLLFWKGRKSETEGESGKPAELPEQVAVDAH